MKRSITMDSTQLRLFQINTHTKNYNLKINNVSMLKNIYELEAFDQATREEKMMKLKTTTLKVQVSVPSTELVTT
jgi:hypothetical protein